MNVPVLTNNLQLIYISSVQTQNVVYKTCRVGWMIGRDGERAREICAVSAFGEDHWLLNTFIRF